jgi:single-strand DNA-binding protein
MNSVCLIGRLANDPREVQTSTDTKIAKFTLAVSRRQRNEADFFSITCFNKLAELILQYMTKGKQIGVTGELRQHRFEKDGENVSYIEVIAQNIQFLDRMERNDSTEQEEDPLEND